MSIIYTSSVDSLSHKPSNIQRQRITLRNTPLFYTPESLDWHLLFKPVRKSSHFLEPRQSTEYTRPSAKYHRFATFSLTLLYHLTHLDLTNEKILTFLGTSP